MAPSKDLIRVQLLALLEEPVMNNPVVILHDSKSNLILPVWIGEFEARAIAVAYQGVNLSRPLTHNLFSHVLQSLKTKLVQVVIDKMEAGTYFAKIYLKSPQRKTVLFVDARPSDAIALALELKRPIYVESTILKRAGQENPFPTDFPDSKKPKSASSQLVLNPKELDDLKQLLQKAREREEDTQG